MSYGNPFRSAFNMPPGCFRTPYDDAPDPSDLQDAVWGVLESLGVAPTTIEQADALIECIEREVAEHKFALAMAERAKLEPEGDWYRDGPLVEEDLPDFWS